MNLSSEKTRFLLGSVLAQLLMLGSMPLLSRVFPPAAVGVLGTVLSFGNMIWSFAQLRTDVAMFQAKDEQERVILFQLGCLSSGVFSLLALGIVHAFCWMPFVRWSQTLLIALFLISNGALQLGLTWLASRSEFAHQNRVRLLAVTLGYPLAVIWVGISHSLSLLFAVVLGNVVALLYLLVSRQARPFWPFRDRAELGQQLRAHGSKGAYLTFANLLASIADQALVLLIAARYGSLEAAAVFFAFRVCGAPLSLVNTGLSQYNYRHFQDLFDQGKFSSNVLLEHWKRWLLPAFLFFLPILLFGPQLFSFFLGKGWNFAGQIASSIAVWSGVKFLSSPTSMGYYVIGRHDYLFAFTVLLAATIPACYFLSINSWDILSVSRFFAWSQIIILIGYNAVMLYKIDQYRSQN